VGVVRVSGPRAVDVVAPLVRGRQPLTDQPSHVLARVTVVDPASGAPLDDALCAVMRAPRSYTGEDIVELSCHGSPPLLGLVVRLIVEHGARLAAPGEFTRRAFLNGRLDLAQAEAVALLIGARTERAAALAARAVAGELSAALAVVRDELIGVIAGLEVTLDFPEEDVGLDTSKAIETISKLRQDVGARLEAARRGRVVHEGFTVALVGAPNAGKSTLLNAIVGRERAIVSPIPGTTRDIVEATIAIAGVPVRLLDTAGLGEPRDALDAEGMRRTRLAAAESDVLLLVLDAHLPPPHAIVEETAGAARVVALAKADLPRDPGHAARGEAIAVSALTGEGMAALSGRLADEVSRRAGADEGGIVATARQTDVLTALRDALASSERGLREAPLEAALIDVHLALRHVGSLLGLDVGEAVLDRIFSAFCLGK
jgi:tRNA modification GTPase